MEDMKSLIDRLTKDKKLVVRNPAKLSWGDTEVDNTVYITSEKPLEIGNFYHVLIEEADSFDLYGTIKS